MSTQILPYQSAIEQRCSVNDSTHTTKSDANSRSWEWLKQSLWQGGLIGTICALAGKSFFLCHSHPIIALGCGVAACTLFVLNKKQISQIHRDFKGLNGFTKVLAMGVPIIAGVTAPALVGYALNASLNECFIIIPLSIFSAGLPFFKARDDNIDRFFLFRSHGYNKRDFDATFRGILAEQALHRLRQPRENVASTFNQSETAADPFQSPIIEEVS